MDEAGHIPFDQDAANLPFGRWGEIFSDDDVADWAADSLAATMFLPMVQRLSPHRCLRRHEAVRACAERVPEPWPFIDEM
ncbi:hypothetical protein AB0G05_44000 [Nonomuraea wenchangensis]